MPGKTKTFLERLNEDRVLVCDGAMGTMLYGEGISFDYSFDELNLSYPEVVERVHRRYVDAGADVIETNTFGANRVRLSHFGFENLVHEINVAGVKLARLIAGRDALVAGAIGPLGKPIEPIGKIRKEQARDYFREQVEGLLEGGVDLFIVETISDLNEVIEIISAIKNLSNLPVVAQMTFTDEGKTILGHKPADVARTARDLGAEVVGANCSVGPQGIIEVMEKMMAVEGVQFSAQPNAGMPRSVGGRYIYMTSPAYFGEQARTLAEMGVRMVGGCCGTTDEHIALTKECVKEMKFRPPTHAAGITIEDQNGEPDLSNVVTAAGSTLLDKLHDKGFTVSVELDPPRGLNYDRVIEGAVLCKKNNIDAVNIADNALAKPGITPLVMAHLINRSVDIDTIIHFSCRDRNLIAMQSELMAANALGVRHVLAVTGDPPSLGDYPHATGVFDIDSIELMKLVTRLNRGVDLSNRDLGSRTSFIKAVAINPTAVDLEREFDRYEQKIEAGADFAMSQILYDVKPLEDFVKRFGSRIPVLVGVMPLRNFKHAKFMHNEIPDINVPDAVRERMHRAGDRGPEEGIRIAKDFLSEARHLVQGTYIMPPFNKFEMAIEIAQIL